MGMDVILQDLTPFFRDPVFSLIGEAAYVFSIPLD